jgi:Tol biopolymer transport system component
MIRSGRPVVLATVVALVGCGPVPSQSVNQPSSVASIEATSSSPAALSLPGWFAFTLAGGDLWVTRADGSDRRQVTSSGDGVDISPTWAPDASQLAFRHSTGAGGGPQDTDTHSHGPG